MNLKLKHFFIIFLILLLVIQVQADAPDVYLPIVTTDQSLSATVFATDGTTTMDAELIDGRLHISDSVHGVKNLRVLESMLVNRLKGYNGKEVMLYHVNDAGVKDSSRLVPIQSDETWTYFYDVEFSEVIIDGFVGTWEVTAYNLSVSDSLNFGQTFNASNVTSLSVNVTDDAIKTSPYSNILDLNPVLWLPLDDNYTDMSGNGNNGTAYGDTHFVNGKYENGSNTDGIGDYVDCGINLGFDLIDNFSFSFIINSSDIDGEHFILDKREGVNQSYSVYTHNKGIWFGWYNGDWNSVRTNDVVELYETYIIYISIDNTNADIYVNNCFVDWQIDSSVLLNLYPNSPLYFMYDAGLANRDFNGTTDNILMYNRVLSESERNNLYYDHLQQLKIKTNSNSTWSTEWNSTANNPIQVPYGAGELFNFLNFTVPETVVQNGITIYDYPSTVQFDAIATVGYTEDITKITEEATAGTYTLNVTHAANNTGEGYINYTTANAVLLDADFWNTATLSTDNPNASLSTTLPHFNISTGYVAATTEYYYLVEQDYFYPPTNIQTTPSQTSVYIEWDAVQNADNYSVYELEDGSSYVDTNPTIDGIKDSIYDSAHEFLIFSPNPITVGDYGTIYPVRTALGAYFLIECVDNDNKKGDDDTIYYFDLDNNGLTTNDYAWKITDNIVKRYNWDGASWKVAGGSNAVGASTGGGTHYPIHELFIPIAELGANWTNGSTVKVLVKREDSALSPDVISWYPYGNINDTDTSLWQEMVLNYPESYNLLANVTLSNYTATNLTPFTIYHGGVSAWNGSQETSYALFDVITDDIPYYSVSGYIKNQDGNPLPDITVYSCNGFISEVTTTNESGYWIGYAFREGNYTICANSTCYIANSIDIHVTDNMTNQNITLNNVIVNNCELMEKLLEIEDIVTPNSTVPTTSQPQNAMPLSLFIAWTLILIGLVYVAYPKRDEDDDMDIGIKNITASFISVILAFTLGKISINGQLVQTFSGMSEINTVVIDTSVIQIGWLGSLFTFIGITMVILTILLLVSEYKDRYGDVEDE